MFDVKGKSAKRIPIQSSVAVVLFSFFRFLHAKIVWDFVYHLVVATHQSNDAEKVNEEKSPNEREIL